MLKIDNLTLDDVVRVLVLERADSGLYHCPRIERHHGDHKNACLSIKANGEFVCTCSAMGRGWIELTSQLYRIPKREAKTWLINKLNGETIGERST